MLLLGGVMIININDKVNKLVKQDENIKKILFELGFKDILKPGMLETVGRFISLKSGAKMKNISLDLIIETFKKKGYEVKDED